MLNPLEDMLADARGVKTGLTNGEFIDLDSIRAELKVTLKFNGLPVTLWTDNADVFRASICVDGDTYTTDVSVDYNPETDKPIIIWEDKRPENKHLRIATDVIVGLMFGVMRRMNPDFMKEPPHE